MPLLSIEEGMCECVRVGIHVFICGNVFLVTAGTVAEQQQGRGRGPYKRCVRIHLDECGEG